MERKIKIIAVALAVISVLVGFIALNYYGRYNALTREKQQLEKEKQTLRQENNVLAQKASDAQEEILRIRKQAEEAQAELGRIVIERDDLQKKSEALSQERDKLIERLQRALAGSSQAVPAPVAPAAQAAAVPDEYWAGVVKQKEGLELQLINLREALKNNQIRMDELAQEKTSFDLEVQRLVKEKADIQRQLEYAEKMADSLSLQLVREKDDKRKVIKQADLFKEENYALRSRVKDLMGAKVSLEKRLNETEEKRIALAGRLNQMDQLLQEKLSGILDAKQDLGDIKEGLAPSSGPSVELPPILVPGAPDEAGVRPAEAEAPSRPGAGEVISVNEENNFVILDIGENQGVHPGQVLYVQRGQQQIAALEVVEVRANICAADIKEKSAPLRVGDSVR